MDKTKSLTRLTAAAHERILSIPGVADSGRGSFRIGKKVFVRLAKTQDGASVFQFKLTPLSASRARANYAQVRPMQFGGMGRHGWIEFTLTRAAQLRALASLLAESRALY